MGNDERRSSPAPLRAIEHKDQTVAMPPCGGLPKGVHLLAEREALASRLPEWTEDSFPGYLGNVAAGRVSNRFDLGGLNSVVDAACAASLSATKMAISELIEGNCDMMITGGVDTDNSPFMYMSFSKTPAFSRKGSIRPFDHDSDGMLIGEGVGMVVCKRLDDALRDGDRIYALIKGIGGSSDGRYKSIYAPRPHGQALAMQRAYDEAGFDPSTVGLITSMGGARSGGSDKREGWLIDKSRLAPFRNFITEPLNFAARYNGWQEQYGGWLRFRWRDTILTTLDTGAGSKKIVS